MNSQHSGKKATNKICKNASEICATEMQTKNHK